MDIRIGNDIKIKVQLPDYIEPSMIVRVLANVEKIHHIHHHNCHTNLYTPTEYTMHKDSCTSYNVLPRNLVLHLHEFFDHCHDHRNNIIAVRPQDVDPETNSFEMWFKANRQEEGDYRLTLNIQVQEEGCGRNDVHEYTIDCGPVFSISRRRSAIDGDVCVEVNK